MLCLYCSLNDWYVVGLSDGLTVRCIFSPHLFRFSMKSIVSRALSTETVKVSTIFTLDGACTVPEAYVREGGIKVYFYKDQMLFFV